MKRTFAFLVIGTFLIISYVEVMFHRAENTSFYNSISWWFYDYGSSQALFGWQHRILQIAVPISTLSLSLFLLMCRKVERLRIVALTLILMHVFFLLPYVDTSGPGNNF